MPSPQARVERGPGGFVMSWPRVGVTDPQVGAEPIAEPRRGRRWRKGRRARNERALAAPASTSRLGERGGVLATVCVSSSGPTACLLGAVGGAGDHARMGGEGQAETGREGDPALGLSYTTKRIQSEGLEGAPEEGSEEAARDRCPNRLGLAMLDYESGVWVPARCTRLACEYCVRVQASVRAAAIWLARPQRAITVTLVADAGDEDPWPTARARMNRLRRNYGRLVGSDLGEWVYDVERNPRGTGFHAHAWQHGPAKVDRHALDEASERAGAGMCKVETVRNRGAAAKYGLKGVGGMGYGLKGADADPLEHLWLNGGRLTHQSRGFYRSEDGSTLAVRAAERLALKALYGEREAGRWGLVTESAAKSWASLPRVGGPA